MKAHPLAMVIFTLLAGLTIAIAISCVYEDDEHGAETDADVEELDALNEDGAEDPEDGDSAKSLDMVKLLASDAQADDRFGAAVSISGDYIIIGANGEDEGGALAGAAYIYHRTGANTWDDGVKIVASDSQVGANFGGSVSISGDYAIVGAVGDNQSGNYSGATYVFHRTGTNAWDAGTKLVAPDAQADDVFGQSVAISSDYAIVGADGEDQEGESSGAAYVFHRTGANTWDSGTKIVAPDAEDEDTFGNSVSISGDYAIAGAVSEGQDGDLRGAAYVFHRTGTNTWDAGTKLVASDAQGGDGFGSSVAIYGDYAMAGADNEDQGGDEAGAAYVFHRTGTNTWDAGTKLVAPDAQAGDMLGCSVSISGDYVVLGAYGWNLDGNDAGAAYIFHRTDTNSWDNGTKLVAFDALAMDRFGMSVSISGEQVIAGAPYEDQGDDDSGAAYVLNFECVSDEACDDGQWCNGAESCSDDLNCQDGSAPCDAESETCDEANDQCDEIGDDDDSVDDDSGDDDDDDSGCCG